MPGVVSLGKLSGVDLFELKIRGRDLLNRVRGLRWNNADERRVIVLIAGVFFCALLVPVAGVVLLLPMLSTTQAQQAAEMNRADSGGDAEPLDDLMLVRDRLVPAVRADERFGGVLIRPGASSQATTAVATIQGSVADRAAFDDLIELVMTHGLIEQVEIVVAIEN